MPVVMRQDEKLSRTGHDEGKDVGVHTENLDFATRLKLPALILRHRIEMVATWQELSF